MGKKSEIFDLFFGIAMGLLWLTCGILLMIAAPVNNLENLILIVFTAAMVFIFPVIFMALILGPEWIEDNISVD